MDIMSRADNDRQSAKQMDEERKLPTWREMNMDTTPEVEKILFKMWREASAWRKVQLMSSLNRSARQLAWVGLKKRHPNASPEELRRRLADMALGPELATCVYGPMIISTDVE